MAFIKQLVIAACSIMLKCSLKTLNVYIIAVRTHAMSFQSTLGWVDSYSNLNWALLPALFLSDYRTVLNRVGRALLGVLSLFQQGRPNLLSVWQDSHWLVWYTFLSWDNSNAFCWLKAKHSTRSHSREWENRPLHLETRIVKGCKIEVNFATSLSHA